MKTLLTTVLAFSLVLGALACTDDPPTTPVDEATPTDVALFGKPAPGLHSYQIVITDTRLTWAEAKRAASRLPSIDRARPHLATFADVAEQATALANATAEGWCWIGLYQNKKATTPDALWTWVTREELTWDNWKAGEPNDGEGVEDGTQNFAYLRFGYDVILGQVTYTWWDDVSPGTDLDCMLVEWE